MSALNLEGLSMQGRVLGRGTFGEVREAVHRASGRKLAVKIIEKAKLNRKRRERVQQEVDVLTHLAEHQGVCRLHQAAQDALCVYLFMEHLNGGDLFDLVQQRGGPLDEDREVRPLFRQLCEAVRYCHSKGVVHCDLKLENCVVAIPLGTSRHLPHHDADDDDDDHHDDDPAAGDEEDDLSHTDRGEETDDDDDPKEKNEESARRSSVRAGARRRVLPPGTTVKLVDFGLACRVERPGQLLATFSGTEQYAAPELLEGRAYDGFKTDAYALGVVLYLLLTAQYPFSPDDVDVQFEEQTSPAFLASLPFPAHVSSGARDLVWSLLRFDPRRRLTVDGALCHPFFLAGCASPGQAATTTTTAPACEESCRHPGSGSKCRHNKEEEEDTSGLPPRSEELQAAVILASLDNTDGDNMSIGY